MCHDMRKFEEDQRGIAENKLHKSDTKEDSCMRVYTHVYDHIIDHVFDKVSWSSELNILRSNFFTGSTITNDYLGQTT